MSPIKKTFLFVLIIIGMKLFAVEYHVSKQGNDNFEETKEKLFLTIQAAADITKPNDVIIVHEGIYREWVNPKFRGDKQRKLN